MGEENIKELYRIIDRLKCFKFKTSGKRTIEEDDLIYSTMNNLENIVKIEKERRAEYGTSTE